jgi:RNA polymerase sigma-70 factor (family 1)
MFLNLWFFNEFKTLYNSKAHTEMPDWQSETGFKVLFNTHYLALVRYAFSFLKDNAAAEDVVQLQFVKLWEKRMEQSIHSSVKAFLYTSVYHACLNAIKHEVIKTHYAKEIMTTQPETHAIDQLQHKELKIKIDKALEFLPAQCALIFKMSRFEELKYQEIADKLGLSIKTVENQMGKALKILREQLKEYLPVLLILLTIHA